MRGLCLGGREGWRSAVGGVVGVGEGGVCGLGWGRGGEYCLCSREQ
jgi:hypothetical protein